MVVADGFTGNIALKLYEGMGKFMGSQLKENIFAGANGKLSSLLVLPKINALTNKIDYNAVGGAMMLAFRNPLARLTAVLMQLHFSMRFGRREIALSAI